MISLLHDAKWETDFEAQFLPESSLWVLYLYFKNVKYVTGWSLLYSLCYGCDVTDSEARLTFNCHFERWNDICKYHLDSGSKYHMNTDEDSVYWSRVTPLSVCSGETEGHVRGCTVHQSVCGKCCRDPHPGWPAQRRPAQNTGCRLHQLVSSHTEKSSSSLIIRSPAPFRRSSGVHWTFCVSLLLLLYLGIITDGTRSHPLASSLGVTVNKFISRPLMEWSVWYMSRLSEGSGHPDCSLGLLSPLLLSQMSVW